MTFELNDNSVTASIWEDLSNMGKDEVARWMSEYPGYVDYRLAQDGNLLVYTDDVRTLFASTFGEEWGDADSDLLWDAYRVIVGETARVFMRS